ncbi:MAG: hypothetical protein KF705_16695 [Phycisphaeraceae bacterium]|nr:hypothetical protein [Phycisphaeraceae bacterium]
MIRERVRQHVRSRAVTLIEVVVVVVVLALTLPPMLVVSNDAGDARLESVRVAEAVALTQGIAEHILADAFDDAGGLGPAAFEDASAYLDHPEHGLWARIEWLTGHYRGRGVESRVEIGEPVDASGVVSETASENRYRRVVITTEFVGSKGRVEMPLVLMVGRGM